MNRHRAFLLGSLSVAVATALLVACSDDGESRPSFVENDEAGNAPEASLPPPSNDGGVQDPDAADATPPKPQYDASDEPVVCTSPPCATQLAGGQDYFCALLSDGSARCWGTDYYGELGRGAASVGGTVTGVPPSRVAAVTNATQISASPLGMTTCVRSAAGRVQCWGVNWVGQLGLQVSPPSTDGMGHPTPTEVALTADIERVDVGPEAVCAIDTSHQVHCWGSNQYGLLARPDDPEVPVGGLGGPGLADFAGHELKRAAIGYESAFGIASDSKIVGWGVVSGRDTSLPSSAPNPGPAPLPTVRDAMAVATSDRFSCAIAGGEVHCWGRNAQGQLGTGFPNDERLPARARVLTDAGAYPQQLALGRTTACVRITDGTIQCVGGNENGRLGRPDAGQASGDYELVPLPGRAVQITASEQAFCALLQGGSVMCWGANTYGELGQGAVDYDAHPLPVAVVLN
ncbi:MAG: hypothetical protein K0S65_5651 [Labilithrix sp.]|nr:hypothetical protein [Labilithrix sp.]